MSKPMSPAKIFVVVRGGVAYPRQDTVPAGYKLEIIDFDSIDQGGKFPSLEARVYCMEHGLWGRKSGR